MCRAEQRWKGDVASEVVEVSACAWKCVVVKLKSVFVCWLSEYVMYNMYVCDNGPMHREELVGSSVSSRKKHMVPNVA